MSNYKTIINAFEDITSRHKQLNTFYHGEEWDFQTQENIYPALLMNPATSIIEDGRFLLTFNVFVIDLLDRSNQNLTEIYSDTLQICGDIISELEDNEDEYGFIVERPASILPIFEELDDKVAGFVMTLNVQLPFEANNCLLPISN